VKHLAASAQAGGTQDSAGTKNATATSFGAMLSAHGVNNHGVVAPHGATTAQQG
jgi:hypothetical protein